MYKKIAFYSLIFCCSYFGITTSSQAADIEILTFGDSVTAGLMRTSTGAVTCPEGVAYEHALISSYEGNVCNGNGAEGVGGYQPTLKSSLEEAGYETLIYNFGYSGLTTSQMTGLTDSFLSVESNSDYVLLMGGANDAFTSVSASTVNFNIETMVKKICAKGMIPVITSVTRRSLSTSINSYVTSYNALINQITNPTDCSSRNIELITADQYNATINGNNFSDGVHLTTTGNLNMAAEWYSALALPIQNTTSTSFLPSIFLLLDE